MNQYLLGYDIGSSSIKVALVDATSKECLSLTHSPDTPMDILAIEPGWAEQSPEAWWTHIVKGTKNILEQTQVDPSQIVGIGISYQMHGLVLLDEALNVLRPAIIWCDSRASGIGKKAQQALGSSFSLEHYLNSPGNFTASKLKWVIDQEPELYQKVRWMMWPGDYIATRLTGRVTTTSTALSEGILWDYRSSAPAEHLLDYYGINPKLIPELVPIIGVQGTLTATAAKELGIPAGIPLGYRAGDQPNNAMSLNVLNPGEVAATAGTSGVVYAVTDQLVFDPNQRVNSFVHVNHIPKQQNRIGVLLCINGAGIMHSWVRAQVGEPGITFAEMENRAATIPVGSDGLVTLPFGNGAERIFQNQDLGAMLAGIQLNRHTRNHIFRSALEGVAFSFVYGLEMMNELGIDTKMIKVGNDNMFQSAIFSQTITNCTGSKIEVIDTTGAIGAALAAGVAAGVYQDLQTALKAPRIEVTWKQNEESESTKSAYKHWKETLMQIIHDKKIMTK